MKISDYLFVINGDQFNWDIKLLSQEKYNQSSMYTYAKGKNGLGDVYRHKQSEIASAALQQQSLASGLVIYFCLNELCMMSLL